MTAKAIFDLILRYAHRNKMTRVRKADIEIGSIQDENHPEDIEPANLKKNIEMMAKNEEITKGLKVKVKKISGQGYRLLSIEGDK